METGMGMSKAIKYVYNSMEEALKMETPIETLFREEGLYIKHAVVPIANNKTLLIFTIKTDNDTTS